MRRRSHNLPIRLEGASREDLAPLMELEVLGGAGPHRRSKVLLVRPKDVLSTVMGNSGAGGGSSFHTVRLIRLTSVEALRGIATLDRSATDTRLQLVDLLCLLSCHLVTTEAGSQAALGLVAIEGERILTVDLAGMLTRLLKVVIVNRQLTIAKNSLAAGVLTRAVHAMRELSRGIVAVAQL